MMRTTCRTALIVFASLTSLGLLAAGEGATRDPRLEKAKTLDDYHPFTPPRDLSTWKVRAERVREQILVAAGLWPMPPRPPISDAVIHGAVDRGDYTVEKVYFSSYPGFYVTGTLYRPKGAAKGLRPGVLCPHGHWPNGRFFERSDADAEKEIAKGAERTLQGAKYPLQARCAMLARMGCVVFHYDMVGNADSKQIGHAAGFRDAEAALRLLSAFGLQTFNSIRALDFLSTLDGVDPKRIAVTGASGGGTQTFFLCAIDDRPAVAFPAVMVSTAMQGGCVCENACLLRVETGNIEFAALMAPRPLGMTGANDWTLEIEKKGLPELKALYGLYGASDKVDAKCYPHFDHNYNQVSREQMYAWVNKHLGLGFPEKIDEKPFEPILPKDLSVFDEAHTLPATATDVQGLRRTLTEISDRQMAELEPRDEKSLEAYRAVVGPALRAIVASELPAPGSLAGSGRQVPSVWLQPEGWSGEVVVAFHEQGSAAFSGSGDATSPLAKSFLDRGLAVLAPDVFLTGAGAGTAFPVDRGRHKDFCGYTYGYNRTPLANRVHDALTAISQARLRGGVKKVHVAGFGKAGLWALLASALAGEAVTRTIVTAPSFDFVEVTDTNDLRFLPGAVKYGGWGGFAALCAPRDLILAGGGELPRTLQAAYKACSGKLEQLPAATPSEAFAARLGR